MSGALSRLRLKNVLEYLISRPQYYSEINTVFVAVVRKTKPKIASNVIEDDGDGDGRDEKKK